MSMYQTGKFEHLERNPQARTPGDTLTFRDITFPTPFPTGSEVIVLVQTQTFNGPHTPGIRIAEVTTTGFKFRVNEVMGLGTTSDGTHYEEIFGYVAYTV